MEISTKYSLLQIGWGLLLATSWVLVLSRGFSSILVLLNFNLRDHTLLGLIIALVVIVPLSVLIELSAMAIALLLISTSQLPIPIFMVRIMPLFSLVPVRLKLFTSVSLSLRNFGLTTMVVILLYNPLGKKVSKGSRCLL